MDINDQEIDEVFNYKLQCIHCKSILNGKPWLSVRYENKIYNACNYSCGVNMGNYVGPNYWDKIINKEDFSEPRPVLQYKKNKIDITTGFGMDEIRREIEEEEKRINELEQNFENSISNSDEEYSE